MHKNKLSARSSAIIMPTAIQNIINPSIRHILIPHTIYKMSNPG